MDDAVLSSQWKGSGKGDQFNVPAVQPKTPPPEESLHYWHPQRFGVKVAPETFRRRLRTLHSDLDVTWHPIRERWLVWFRQPRIQFKHCPGWMLLFPVETSDGDYVPLDERTLAAAYQQSGFRWGNGKAYWDHIQGVLEREHEVRERDRDGFRDDYVSDTWEYQKIKNIGKGSKFADHHSEAARSALYY